jgi:hypothetical protein
VLDAVVRPPLLVRRALAAARTSDTSSIALSKPKGATIRGLEQAGRRARSAVQNGEVDPRKVADRLKGARGAVPALYRVRVRYDLQLVQKPKSG